MTNKETLIIDLDPAIQLYRKGKLDIDGVEYYFLNEVEENIVNHGNRDIFSFRYTRDIKWTIKDNNGNKYLAEITEYGDSDQDMSLEPNGSIVFTKIYK